MEQNISVSIVIVCMNNMENLYPCLNSIRKHTSCSYEVLVTAYLFSPENLARAKRDFPWVKFIESNSIRGFSENNNLALFQAVGKYCFVLNDDTEMKMPVVDQLLESFRFLPNAGIVSPKFLNQDGSIQVCGRMEYSKKTYFRAFYCLPSVNKPFEYVEGTSCFVSRQILGAGFMISRALFQKIGWFNEDYFFAPEDLEVGRKVEKEGFTLYVNESVELIHYGGMTGRSMSMISTATKPANIIGGILYYSEGNLFWEFVFRIHEFIGSLMRYMYHSLCSLSNRELSYHSILAIGYYNAMKECLRNRTPKEVFTSYYSKLNK